MGGTPRLGEGPDPPGHLATAAEPGSVGRCLLQSQSPLGAVVSKSQHRTAALALILQVLFLPKRSLERVKTALKI